MSIGERLRNERERLKLTQPEFAAIADAKKRTLIDWEQGVSSPTAVQLSALSSIGVDVLYVLTGARVVAQTHELADPQALTPPAPTPQALTPLESVSAATEVAMRRAKKPKRQARIQEAVYGQLQSASAQPLNNNDLPSYTAPVSHGERRLLKAYQAADDKGKKIIEDVADFAAQLNYVRGR